MRCIWCVTILGPLLFASAAAADTVYLRDGRTVWGSSVEEKNGIVIIERPGDPLRIPKGEVLRIESRKVSVPLFYGAPDPPAQPPEKTPAPAVEASVPARPEPERETPPVPPPAPSSPPTLSGPFSPMPPRY